MNPTNPGSTACPGMSRQVLACSTKSHKSWYVPQSTASTDVSDQVPQVLVFPTKSCKVLVCPTKPHNTPHVLVCTICPVSLVYMSHYVQQPLDVRNGASFWDLYINPDKWSQLTQTNGGNFLVAISMIHIVENCKNI